MVGIPDKGPGTTLQETFLRVARDTPEANTSVNTGRQRRIYRSERRVRDRGLAKIRDGDYGQVD